MINASPSVQPNSSPASPSVQPNSQPPPNPRRMINHIPPRTYFGQPVIDLESLSSDSDGSLDINENVFGMSAENTVVIAADTNTAHASPSRSSILNQTDNNSQLSTNGGDATAPYGNILPPPDIENIVTAQAPTETVIENVNENNPEFVRVTVLPPSQPPTLNDSQPNNTATVIPMSQITSPSIDPVVHSASQRSLPTLPMFTRGPGADAVVSILAMARSEGYQNTLVHGKRISWFVDKNEMWFAPGGILAHYRKTSPLTIRQKFKSAEDIAQTLWDGRTHQNDSTGERDES